MDFSFIFCGDIEITFFKSPVAMQTLKEQEDGFESSKDKRNADVTLANCTSFINNSKLSFGRGTWKTR